MFFSSVEAAKVVFLYGQEVMHPGIMNLRPDLICLPNISNAQKKVNLQASVHAGWPEDDSYWMMRMLLLSMPMVQK